MDVSYSVWNGEEISGDASICRADQTRTFWKIFIRFDRDLWDTGQFKPRQVFEDGVAFKGGGGADGASGIGGTFGVLAGKIRSISSIVTATIFFGLIAFDPIQAFIGFQFDFL